MSTFFSGLLDPFWPHVTLLSVAIVASFAVAIGIVMESPHWSVANALVVGGVAIEAVCTLLLFGFDEGISQAQQSKIVAMQARPWTKAQFDALQRIKGKVADVGIFPEKDCLECRWLSNSISLALHAAGVQLHGDDSLEWGMRGTGVMVWLPRSDASTDKSNDPLVVALREAGLNPSFAAHIPPEISRVRTDIPVIFVGERFVQFSEFPYFPEGQSGWTILPLANPQFVPTSPTK